MNGPPTSLDFLAAIIILIILVISGFTLLGTGILMAIGAVFSKRPLVTSWPSEQEHSFTAFEQRSAGANAMAWVFSVTGAVLLTVVAVGIYVGVPPDKRDVTKDMNMSNLTKKRAAPVAKPDTPEAARPDSAAPAEAPKADAPKTAPPAEAPKQ